MTFSDFDSLARANPDRFGFPSSYGTSMAAPEVAATAALVIASRVLGPHPSPDQILAAPRADGDAARRLDQPNAHYGYGLVNAGAATAPLPTTAPPALGEHRAGRGASTAPVRCQATR